MAKPSKEVPHEKNGLEFVIMLAFGHTNDPVHRTNISEFKRKSLNSITDIKDVSELFETVRIAPSASNSQPWFFSGNPDEIIVCREKLNVIRAVLYNKMNQIDIGIALFHLWITFSYNKKSISFDTKEVPVPKGYEFMVNVKVMK